MCVIRWRRGCGRDLDFSLRWEALCVGLLLGDGDLLTYWMEITVGSVLSFYLLSLLSVF